MTVETWQDAIGTLATLRGYPDILLQIKHIHQDLLTPIDDDDIRPSCYSRLRAPAMCVCEVVSGLPPDHWESCIPWGGYYRVAAKDLNMFGPLEALAYCADSEGEEDV